MDARKMSQKEYLQKYLNNGDLDNLKKTKKKKKRPAIGTKTVKIIDDDLDIRGMRPLRDGELEILNTTEDAPQIVGIVDERGAAAADFADRRRWRIIADDGDGNVTCGMSDERPAVLRNDSQEHDAEESFDGDLSPPRVARRDKKKRSKRRRESSECSHSDQSPPRRKTKDKESKNDSRSSKTRNGESRRRDRSSVGERSDSDQTPPRRTRDKESKRDSRNSTNSRSDRLDGESRIKEKSNVHEQSDSDQSPPRRKNKNGESRKREKSNVHGHSDSDQSPPRRKNKERESNSKRKEKSLRRGCSDSDQSPPRRRRNSSDSRKLDEGSRKPEVPRRSSSDRTRDDYGRRNRQNRREGEARARDSRSRRQTDERASRNRPRSSEDESSSENDASGRMKKTIDGKTAGLQDARALKIECEAHKKREAESFKKLSSEVSGLGQAAVFRDRKTGRRRDFAAEESERREKDKIQAEIDEKYAKWGKGLKQVDDEAEKRQSDLYEMSKPLARYANDPDLDRALREVEREGDTMLAEIRKRRIKEGKSEPARPTYRGSYAPNRFGIKPGHRWDGVDRSNGYEKKWFEARNARKAIAEEAYKWSTADM